MRGTNTGKPTLTSRAQSPDFLRRRQGVIPLDAGPAQPRQEAQREEGAVAASKDVRECRFAIGGDAVLPQQQPRQALGAAQCVGEGDRTARLGWRPCRPQWDEQVFRLCKQHRK